MTTIPTECEVALLRMRASTHCTQCNDCKRVAARLRHTAGDGDPPELCRAITASDCTLGRLEP